MVFCHALGSRIAFLPCVGSQAPRCNAKLSVAAHKAITRGVAKAACHLGHSDGEMVKTSREGKQPADAQESSPVWSAALGRLQVAVPAALLSAALVLLPCTACNAAAAAAQVIPSEPTAILDGARLLSDARKLQLEESIRELEEREGWKLRVLTRLSPAAYSGEEVRSFWKPDDRTIIIIEDVSSPNILNFNTGDFVRTKLPRAFFSELQSRFGNQFFVAEEGELNALLQTVDVLKECLSREEACLKVPGVSDDLYVLTLGTSIVGGAVFGFAARVPPSGNVRSSWQWILIFSPLWFILYFAFGSLPILQRTDDVVPLVKNTVGFFTAAGLLYLTPIFGDSPIAKSNREE